MKALFALDTCVYIEAFRNVERLRVMKRFLLRKGQQVHLAAVAAMELRAGARTREQQVAVESLLAPYVTRGLLITPSFEAYVHAGRVVAELSARGGTASGVSPHRLVNDALLAASCRECDVTLVTSNIRDFAAIRGVMRDFSFVDAATM